MWQLESCSLQLGTSSTISAHNQRREATRLCHTRVPTRLLVSSPYTCSSSDMGDERESVDADMPDTAAAAATAQPLQHVFPLDSPTYTPARWLEDLERFKTLNDAASSRVVAPQLLYPLHVATRSGRADIVQLMLEKVYREDLDGEGDTGCSPLQIAVCMGNMAITRALLAAGAEASLRCEAGLSALDLAAFGNHVEIARVIIEHGVDASAAGPQGRTSLHVGATFGNADIVSLLCLDGGAPVDAMDETGCTPILVAATRTPILVAATRGNVAVARALLAAGADVTLRENTLDLSPLDLAAGAGHLDVLRTLVEHGGDVKAVSRDGLTALHVAACRDKAEVIDALVEAGADVDADEVGPGVTPLHVAANCCYSPNVLALLQHGSNVAKKNAREQTPLHVAAAAGTRDGNLGAAKVVDLLLRHGADEKATDSNGQTAADRIRTLVQGQRQRQEHLAEGVERVIALLANASADRAWRRRGFLVLCRAHYPSGRVLLGQVGNHTIAKRTRSRAKASRAEIEWAGMANMLMGAGADPISLDIIFEAVVTFL